MGNVNNSETLRQLREAFQLQLGSSELPTSFSPSIVPVVELNPKFFPEIKIVATVNSATTGTATVYSTPADKDFYIVGISFAMAKDATCDIATGSILIGATLYDDGTGRTLVGFPTITLTAQQFNQTVIFPSPIKLARSTNVTHSGSYTAGVMSRITTIYGFFRKNVAGEQ